MRCTCAGWLIPDSISRASPGYNTIFTGTAEFELRHDAAVTLPVCL